MVNWTIYYLKPLSAQFVVSLRTFNVVVFFRFLFAILIFLSSLVIIGWQFSWFFIIQFLWSMLISTNILYTLSFIGVTSAFWVGNATNLYFLPCSFTGLTFLPMDIFPTVINEIITFIIPLVFIATVPAQVLF